MSAPWSGYKGGVLGMGWGSGWEAVRGWAALKYMEVTCNPA